VGWKAEGNILSLEIREMTRKEESDLARETREMTRKKEGKSFARE
jgi:hypothetical protein